MKTYLVLVSLFLAFAGVSAQAEMTCQDLISRLQQQKENLNKQNLELQLQEDLYESNIGHDSWVTEDYREAHENPLWEQQLVNQGQMSSLQNLIDQYSADHEACGKAVAKWSSVLNYFKKFTGKTAQPEMASCQDMITKLQLQSDNIQYEMMENMRYLETDKKYEDHDHMIQRILLQDVLDDQSNLIQAILGQYSSDDPRTCEKIAEDMSAAIAAINDVEDVPTKEQALENFSVADSSNRPNFQSQTVGNNF